MDQKVTNNRLHGLDALRAIAMFLGLVLHAAIAYKVVPLPNWPSDGMHKSYAWDFLYAFIHNFRMPLFYLIAGYFCNMLVLKIGVRPFIHHRIKRILIPFVGSIIILLPFTTFPFLLYKNLLLLNWNWNEAAAISAKQLLKWNGMAHFWFLYYLLFYYCFFLLVSNWFKKGAFVEQLVKKEAWNIYIPLLSVAGVFLILLLHKEVQPGVDTGIIPDPVYLAYYGIFFFIGAVIFFRNSYFEIVKHYAYTALVIGSCLSAVTFYIHELANVTVSPILLKLLFSVQTVLLVNGFLGFFLRIFTKDRPIWRYFSDASYWVYLLHLGLVALFQILLIGLPINSVVKFAVVLLLTVVICLFSYHYVVRYTFIGRYLHGPRKKNNG